MKVHTCTLLLLLCSTSAKTQDFEIPASFYREGGKTPANYLKSLKIPNLNKSLNDAQKKSLCKLFIEASRQTKKKYSQDMPLDTNVAAYQLLKQNFPDVKKLEMEHGSFVFLGDIEKFLTDKKNMNPRTN